MTPVSQFRAHHQWLWIASAGRVGVCKNSLFCVIAPSKTFGAGASGTPKEPTVPRWPVRVTHGHRGYEGIWAVVGEEMS